MSYQIEPQMYQNFKGIREFNGVNAGGEISAITSENVEFVQTEIGSATSIKSMYGNKLYKSLGLNYNVVGIFETQQDDLVYKIIYAEDDTQGKLFYIGIDDQVNEIQATFTKTGECNGLTMSSSAFDVFIFTNGEERKALCFTNDQAYEAVIEGKSTVRIGTIGYLTDIDAKDRNNNPIKWLSMTEWNGFLVVASQRGVNSSHQNDIYVWNEDPQDVADSWYIEFSKKVTAVASFTGGLYIFTATECSLLNTTPNDTTNSKLITSSGVGCFSYSSLVKHDTYLFFYDNQQKNVYYLAVTDTTGQTKPTGPVAKEIQSYLENPRKIKMFSCVYNKKNEIWCLVDDNILILDYTQQEWTTRKEQSINTLTVSQNTVLSGDNIGNIYIENVGKDFSGSFYPSEYTTTIINLGTNTNLKKQKTPLLLTLDTNYTNDFWVQIIRNSKAKNPKRVKVSFVGDSRYTNDDETPNEDNSYDNAIFVPETIYNKRVVEISTPQTWYTLGVRIYTDTKGQGFFINSMELKNLKGKTKTKGR